MEVFAEPLQNKAWLFVQILVVYYLHTVVEIVLLEKG